MTSTNFSDARNCNEPAASLCGDTTGQTIRVVNISSEVEASLIDAGYSASRDPGGWCLKKTAPFDSNILKAEVKALQERGIACYAKGRMLPTL